MQKLIKMKATKLDKIKAKKAYNIVRELYIKRLQNYYEECNELSYVKKCCVRLKVQDLKT